VDEKRNAKGIISRAETPILATAHDIFLFKMRWLALTNSFVRERQYATMKIAPARLLYRRIRA
jgi:hypothetical protein